jgi:hypothetical protein
MVFRIWVNRALKLSPRVHGEAAPALPSVRHLTTMGGDVLLQG